MANGIKLRRGLKTALAGTIADGEFVFCTDSGELGFKKGTVEKYVDLEKLSTDIDGLQTEIDEVTANQEVLLPGEFKVNVKKFYDFNVLGFKPINNGGYMIPIAKVNPLFIGKEFALHQVFNLTNVSIKIYNFNSHGVLTLSKRFIDYLVVDTQSDGKGGLELHYDDINSSSGCNLQILDDGYGNFSLWLEVGINSTETQKLGIKFTMNCISEVGKDLNNASYNVFLPPLGLEITPYNGA